MYVELPGVLLERAHRLAGVVRGELQVNLLHLPLSVPGELHLEELAAAVGLTTFQLIGLFKRTTGLTPHAYLTQIRLGMACRRLRHSQAIAEIATEVGFYDQSALSRHFKRCYGITPLQFARAAA